MIILSLLSKDDLNGYNIKKKFEDIGGISTGTLYPLLNDMLRTETIRQVMTSVKAGYTWTITAKGKKELSSMVVELENILTFVKKGGFKIVKTNDVKNVKLPKNDKRIKKSDSIDTILKKSRKAKADKKARESKS
jgi:DNA-binding PadR family transcriptional regulator